MKYFVNYTDKCEPKMIEFKSKIARDKWVNNFLLNNQFNEDNYIDQIFEGEITWINTEGGQIIEEDKNE